MNGRTIGVIVAVVVFGAISIRMVLRWRAIEHDKRIAAQLETDGAACKYHAGRVTQVSFSGRDVPERTLQRLSELPKLKRLVFIACPLKDESLQYLTQLPLREFVLMDSAISDKELATLQQLKTLEYLHLSGGNITDAGMNNVAKLDTLVRLDLESIDISDQGLAVLKDLHLLEKLLLADISVSQEGLAELQRHLPQTDIFLDQKRH